MYRAYVVYVWDELSGVFKSRAEAQAYCDRVHAEYHDNSTRIVEQKCRGKLALEDLLQDNLTDGQAAEYLEPASRNARQSKAVRLASRIELRIFSHFDECDLGRAMHLLNRWNCVRLIAYSGERELTPGEMLDKWVEQRRFESNL